MGKIEPNDVSTHSFDWGMIKWLVTPSQTTGANLTFGEVILLPEQGHERHHHPQAEEILYVLSGEGEQMVDDQESFRIRAGDLVHIPKGVYHSTYNKGWEPLRLLAIYNPGGPETELTVIPDFQEVPAGQFVTFRRNEKA